MVLILVPPIAQDPEFHNFADQREYIGIPHFWNVMTNIPFIIIGITGLIKFRKDRYSGVLPNLKNAYIGFFTGLILIGLGSGYYHLEPSNTRLVWDRIAITVSLMSFFVLVLGESTSTKSSAKLLRPLLLIGLASVVYWYLSENLGAGDLRIYGLIQFLPMLLIPLMLFFFESILSGRSWILVILVVYAVAKIAEFCDHQIYEIIYFSGHSLKHFFSAFGATIFLVSLRFRKPVN